MWKSFRNNVENHGLSQFSSLVNNQIQASRILIGGLISGTAVIDSNNYVYVGSSNRLFVCLYNGQIKWTYKLDQTTHSYIVSSAALNEEFDLVIVPGGDGAVHSLNIFTGKLEWKFKPEILTSFESNVQIDSRGYVYLGSNAGLFYCLDGLDGNVIWSFETRGKIWGCACLVLNEKFVIFGCFDHYLYVLDSNTGECVDRYKTHASIQSSPLFYNNKVFVCNSNGELYCFQVINEKSSSIRLKLVYIHNFDCEISSSLAIKDDIIVITKMDGEILTMGIEDRTIYWEYQLNSPICSSPLITNNNQIIVATSDGKICIFDLFYKRLLGTFDISMYSKYRNMFSASPTLDDKSNIYIGNFDGHVYKIPSYLCLKSQKIQTPINNDYFVLVDNTENNLIKQFKFNVLIHPYASIASLQITNDNVDDIIPYKMSLSSDGKYVNFIPTSIRALNIPYALKIRGMFTPIRDRWWKSRFEKNKAFETMIQLHPVQYLFDPTFDRLKQDNVICWNIGDIFPTQPDSMDIHTSISLNTVGYIAYAFGFHNHPTGEKHFNFLILPGLIGLEDEKYIFDKNIEKIHTEKAIYYKGLMFTHSPINEEFNTFVKINGTDLSFIMESCNIEKTQATCHGKYTIMDNLIDNVSVYFNKTNIFVDLSKSLPDDILSIIEFDENNDPTLYKFLVNDDIKKTIHRRKNMTYVVVVNEFIITIISSLK